MNPIKLVLRLELLGLVASFRDIGLSRHTWDIHLVDFVDLTDLTVVLVANRRSDPTSRPRFVLNRTMTY